MTPTQKMSHVSHQNEDLSKMGIGKTFSRRGCQECGLLSVWKSIDVGCNLKRFDGLTRLTPTTQILRLIYATGIECTNRLMSSGAPCVKLLGLKCGPAARHWLSVLPIACTCQPCLLVSLNPHRLTSIAVTPPINCTRPNHYSCSNGGTV